MQRERSVNKSAKRGSVAANRRAFVDIFGDPTALPEAIPGHYQNFKGRGPVAAMKNNFGEGKATRNPASPNIIDFFCDVDRVVGKTLTQDEQDKLLSRYIYEDDDHGLSQAEQNDIEQRLGKAFREAGISPVTRYFTAIRGVFAMTENLSTIDQVQPVAVDNDIIVDVTRQMKEEIGTDTLSKDDEFMLRQKYGLSAPQLTLSEQNLIRREERNAARNR